MDVAVVAMWVVQPTINQIIHVVAVRHGLMSAPVSMFVTFAVGSRSAICGILVVDCDDVFVHMVPVHIMQMAIVQVVCVITVADGNVATV